MANKEKLVSVKFKKRVMLYGSERKVGSTLDGVSVHDANLLVHNEQAEIFVPSVSKKGDKE
jgi:hypothetical protein